MTLEKNTFYFILITVLIFFLNQISLAVEPTTFPTNKSQPKQYPGEIWKTDKTSKEHLQQKEKRKTYRSQPKQYPGSIWKTDETSKEQLQQKEQRKSYNSKKTIERKGVKESGGMIDPELGD